VAPYNRGLTQILPITLPACIVGIVVTALIVNRMWKDLDEDPEGQARIASGGLAPPAAAAAVPVGSAPATAAIAGSGTGTPDAQPPAVPQSGTDMANLDTDAPAETAPGAPAAPVP